MVPLQRGSQQPLRFRVKAEFARVYPELEPQAIYSGNTLPDRRDVISVMLRWPHGIVRQLAVRRAHVDELAEATSAPNLGTDRDHR